MPQDYELHFLGGLQCEATWLYMENIAQTLKRKFYVTQRIDKSEVDHWLEDKNYLLCSSITEGNPNNVIEAMAKGIKPIVHNYPDADNQFGSMMSPKAEYNSKEYREIVEKKFGLNSYKELRKLIEEVLK